MLCPLFESWGCVRARARCVCVCVLSINFIHFGNELRNSTPVRILGLWAWLAARQQSAGVEVRVCVYRGTEERGGWLGLG